MSNVHGLGSFGNNDNAQPNNRPMPAYNQGQGGPRDRNQMGDNVVMVGAGDGDEENARFPPMSKTLAPDFDKNTFIWWITVLQIVMFIVELAWGQIKYNNMFDKNNTMAGPDSRTMRDLGGKDTTLIQDGEIWRLVMPALLHGGILHIFMNLFFQTMLCYTYEKKWGTGRMAYFYFMTAIGSSVMSAVCNPNSISVGASGSLFGMLGCQMSYLIMNWSENPYGALGQGQPQQQGGMMGNFTPNQSEMCRLVCIILINFSFSSVDSGAHIDNYAHGGGLISGFLIGFPFVAKADHPPECCPGTQNVKIFGLLCTLAFFGAMLGTLFFNM